MNCKSWSKEKQNKLRYFILQIVAQMYKQCYRLKNDISAIYNISTKSKHNTDIHINVCVSVIYA